MYWIIGALAFISLFFSARYYIMRREIKRIKSELPELAINARYGKRLYLEENDSALSALILEINRLVDDYETRMYDSAEMEHNIRLSVSGISHDLRTPLTSLAGFLQLMKKTSQEEKRQEYLALAQQAALVLHDLVERFYELSRLELDNSNLILENLNLEHAVCDCFLRFYEDFEGKNIELAIKEAAAPPMVTADKVALHRMLNNLIQNLLRYAHGTVDICFFTKDGFCAVQIGNDSSIPLPDEIDSIFDRFQTADKSRNGPGLGLGLYICRRLVNAMDGIIGAEKDGKRLLITVKLREASKKTIK